MYMYKLIYTVEMESTPKYRYFLTSNGLLETWLIALKEEPSSSNGIVDLGVRLQRSAFPECRLASHYR